MRDRKKQRELRKLKEKRLNKRDDTGLLDLTPYEAVERIIRKSIKAALKEDPASGDSAETSDSEEEQPIPHNSTLQDLEVKKNSTDRSES